MRDTREKAFSILVPQGWKTYGGLFRFSTIDARMIVDMTSPDGLTNLRIGDSTVPPYRVPGPFLRPGPGVAAYAPGKVFASQVRSSALRPHVPGTASDQKRCGAAKVSSRSEAGSLEQTAGEAFYSCTRNGAPMSAYVYAETTLMGPGGPGSSWLVTALGSLIAPSPQAVAAGAMLQHSGESLVMNPAWLACRTS